MDDLPSSVGLREIIVKNNCAFTNLAKLTQWTTFFHPWDPFALVFGKKTYVPSRDLVPWGLRENFAQL